MDMVGVMAQCNMCKSLQAVDVPKKSWEKYTADRNALVQDIFPLYSSDEREILIGADSGVYHCPPCWEKMIPWDEE